MEVLAIVHGQDTGPELFTDIAARAGHSVTEWHIAREGAPPSEPYDAVVVFGGHQNVGEEALHPWLVDEYAAVKRWVADGTPFLGVCLGAQLLAHALGGDVRQLPTQLAGFYETQLTPAGRHDPVIGSLPERFSCFNGNAWQFIPPNPSIVLATGPVTQAFRYGEAAWGVQFHPELKRFSVGTWFKDQFDSATLDALRRAFNETVSQWIPLGERLFEAFFLQAQRLRQQRLASAEADTAQLQPATEGRSSEIGLRTRRVNSRASDVDRENGATNR